MKKKLLITIISVLVASIIIFANYNKKNKDFEKNQSPSEEIENISEEDVNTIEEIKSKINATASTDMYQIDEEYDGRKIIQIKSDIQYDTVLAGILKNSLPKENEIDEILKNRPKKSGIWISENSREKFLELLKENNIQGCIINEQGYLETNNDKNSTINDAIESNKLYVIDISGKCYQRDEITGRIIEYPFEEMEPDRSVEIYPTENSTIILVTNNYRKTLTNKQILEDILANMD